MLAASRLKKMPETPQSRTLKRALEVLGGPQQLAAALGVEPDEFAPWLAGETVPPTYVYVTALEIVARGGIKKKPGG